MRKHSPRVAGTINEAKQKQRQGRWREAEKLYTYLLNFVLNDHDARANDYDHGVVMHQLASIKAVNNVAREAHEHFKQSREDFADDPMSLARLIRDEGNFNLLQGNTWQAHKLVREALEQIKLPGAQSDVSLEQYEIEVEVTTGFLYRIDIVEGKKIPNAVEYLRKLDSMLEAYGKRPEYQLANLGWLIDVVPDKDDRVIYIRKAIKLSSEIGNKEKQREYRLLLLGGTPLKQLYRISTSLTSPVTSAGKRLLLRR
jgi:hypothetical protein